MPPSLDDLTAKERSNLKRRLHRVWSSDLTIEEVVGEMAVCLRCRDRPGFEFVAGESRACSLCAGTGVMAGVTAEIVACLALEVGLPEERASEFYIPDAAEIRLTCAKIRMGWTTAQRDAALRGTMHVDAGGGDGVDDHDPKRPRDRRPQGRKRPRG